MVCSEPDDLASASKIGSPRLSALIVFVSLKSIAKTDVNAIESITVVSNVICVRFKLLVQVPNVGHLSDYAIHKNL